ncbi:MAG: hypothetical protein PVF33_03220, partial [Candidatus Latescibacterota bacterium]
MLKERERKILKAVVDLYVANGRPVSSRAVKESGFAVSTASIRNYMASLERQGYLEKPHTSAGRMPTDVAYRYYVDDLEANRARWDELTERCRSELRDESRDAGEIMMIASRLLGEISENLAVVYGSLVRESRVRHVQLVPLDGPRLLVVVHMVPEYERTTSLRFGTSFDADVVAGAQSLINDTVAGKTLDEAKDAIDDIIRDNVTEEGIITREISINRNAVFSDP